MPPQKITLTADQIDNAAQQIVGSGEEAILTIDGQSQVVTPDLVDEASYAAINARVVELIEANQKAKQQRGVTDAHLAADKKDGTTQISTAAEQGEGGLPGGAQVPEGYAFVGTFTDRDADVFNFDSLLHRVEIDNEADGLISATLEGRPLIGTEEAHRYGSLRCRVIVDHGVRAYVFRQDDENADGGSVTRILVNLGHNAPPATPL